MVDLFLNVNRGKVYISHGGTVFGGKMSVEEVTVDQKGRVQIPKAIRDKVGLHVGGKARLKIEKENIVIMPPISPDEFIREMEGCIKEGVPEMDPLNLKKMWETTEKISERNAVC